MKRSDSLPISDPEGTDRRRSILEAALTVFAREGFDRASIKKIAAEAGIASPALIYHYFDNKRALFGAALRNAIPLFERAEHEPPDDAPAQVLTDLAQLYLDALRRPEMSAMVRLVLGEGARDPEAVVELFGGAPQQFIAYLRRYLERQVALGALRPHDSGSLARSFVGSLMFHVLTTRIVPLLSEDAPDDDSYARVVVATLLHGVANDG